MSEIVAAITSFLQQTMANTRKDKVVVAVSGGIDSATVLSLSGRALGADHVYALLLPYGNQDMSDAQAACQSVGLNATHIRVVDIQPVVDALAQQLRVTDPLRRGNLMARVRMIVLYDWAKELGALVCGTENKSEKYLGYFTRFGDAASDIEPIQHLTKTQLRALADELGVPRSIQDKPPSAGLWDSQTDEAELGFTYAQADQVIALLIDQKLPLTEVIARLPQISPATIQAIQAHMAGQHFKLVVPYCLPE
jgi:NAD+ synthase